MWSMRKLGPTGLARVALAGVLYSLAVTTIACALTALAPSPVALHVALFDHAGWPLRSAVAILIFVPGVVVSMRAGSVLKEGIRLERWSDEQLDPLRRQIDQPIWSALSYCLVAAMLAMLLLPHKMILSGVGAFASVPLNVLSSLKQAVRKPRPPKLIDRHTFKPMQSEHWGHQS